MITIPISTVAPAGRKSVSQQSSQDTDECKRHAQQDEERLFEGIELNSQNDVGEEESKNDYLQESALAFFHQINLASEIKGIALREGNAGLAADLSIRRKKRPVFFRRILERFPS